jgi:hypothetical protein
LLGMVASKPPPPLSERAPHVSVPSRVERIVMRLLEKSPDARFKNADEALAALDDALLALDRAAGKATRSTTDGKEHLGSLHEADASLSLNPPPSSSASMSMNRPSLVVRRGPPFALLAACGLILIVGVVIAAIVLRNKSAISALEEDPRAAAVAAARSASPGDAGVPSTDAAAPDAEAAPTEDGAGATSARVTAEQLEDARAAGLAALTDLAARYEGDPSVLKALMVAQTREKTTYGQAVRTARKLLSVAPDKATDPDVERSLLMIANGPLETADSALEVMATSMGSRGPDLLYELLIAPGIGKHPKEVAGLKLKDPAVRRLATPALLVANELRLATPCARKDLFAQAKADGDARALGLLKPLLVTTGCKWHRRADCFPCLKNRADLRSVVDAIEQRLTKR